jgi:streptomycin 6-kinase
VSLTVPESFVEGFADQEWLARLPALAGSLMDRWDLTLDGAPMHGACALVLPVRRANTEPAVLKVTWPHDEAEHEPVALALWDGDGAVRLLAHDPGSWALLLERLDPTTTLETEPLHEALAVIAGKIRRLDRPAPPQVRRLRDVAARWAGELRAENTGFVPEELVDQAVAYCRELGPQAGNHLVNEDLHFQNVLRGEREPWLVIDPKPIAGDREFGLCQLLWNRFGAGPVRGRLDTVVDMAGLDRELARKWTFVRAVDNQLYFGQDNWQGDICGEIATALA